MRYELRIQELKSCNVDDDNDNAKAWWPKLEIEAPPVKTKLLSVKFELGPFQILRYARSSATFSDDSSPSAPKRPTMYEVGTEHKVPAHLGR